MENVTIGNGVTNIPNGIFSNCTSLTSIEIPNTIISIGESAFDHCTSLISIAIPNSVTSIGNKAFSGCTGLNSIELSDSVTSIGSSAFYGCTGLTSLTIPNSLTSINDYTFRDCSSLASITITNSVTSIGYEAFTNCTSLKSVIIGNSVAFIGRKAFCDCSDLNSVTALNPTPVSIWQDAFTNRTNATLYVPKGSKEAYQAASYWKEFKEIKNITPPTHKLIYIVDGEEYKSYDVEEGESIIPEAEPTKEGYTFSGWSEIPETMPASDVTITGTFTINKYKLTYKVDGEVIKSYDVEYGATITPEPAPTKEGFTFSGWSDIPKTMPAHDVTITGTFTRETGIDQIMSNQNGKAMIFTIDGKHVDNLKKGLNIIRMKNGKMRKVVVK